MKVSSSWAWCSINQKTYANFRIDMTPSLSAYVRILMDPLPHHQKRNKLNAPLHDHVFEGSCDFMGGISSFHVTNLLSLLATYMVVVETFLIYQVIKG